MTTAIATQSCQRILLPHTGRSSGTPRCPWRCSDKENRKSGDFMGKQSPRINSYLLPIVTMKD